jgi:predicted NBD/HSP70 family sugar kinase
MEESPSITERRRQTRNGVYQRLYQSETPLSKPELAHALGLSMPTIHQNIRELLAMGLVRPDGAKQSTGGRRAVGYAVDVRARFAVGISIMTDHLDLLATDLRLQEIAYKKTAAEPMPLHSMQLLGERVAAELETFLDESRLERAKMLGVGVTLPAVLNAERDRIVLAPTMQLSGTGLKDFIRCIRYPLYMENDATSAGDAEWFMRGQAGDMAYLLLDNGVGGAVLLNGEPYLGACGRSGEFGHMCVEPGGLPCSCGKRGCLEAYCSTSRLSTGLGITLDEFFSGLAQGNPTHAALWSDVLRHLAVGINNIHMALDCDVVLGGQLSEYMRDSLPELRKMAAALNIYDGDGDYIRLCRLPRRSAMMGVALHFVRAFLQEL